MNKRKVRVLIVEDDAMVIEMIEEVLKDSGYIVADVAIDGRQAVEMAQSLRPDVILMDIAMPEMDGIEATQRIQKRCPTPVVVLTAYETPELVQWASAAGVVAYLVKPPNARDTDRAITIAIARFDDLMELRRLNTELQDVLARVKTLSGLLPTCVSCRKVRDDEGYWNQLEVYIEKHSEAEFTQSICPECAKKLSPQFFFGDDE